MATELELKFYANTEVFNNVLSAFSGNYEKFQMETTYFDTPQKAFSARKMTLRRRFENGISVYALKTPLPGNARGEWEVNAERWDQAIPQLLAGGAPSVLEELAKEGLTPICGAKFTRLALPLKEKDFSAEIALDEGILTGNGKSLPLCELEIELKEGDAEAFLTWGRAFAALYGLTECKESKFRRAISLCAGE